MLSRRGRRVGLGSACGFLGIDRAVKVLLVLASR